MCLLLALFVTVPLTCHQEGRFCDGHGKAHSLIACQIVSRASVTVVTAAAASAHAAALAAGVAPTVDATLAVVDEAVGAGVGADGRRGRGRRSHTNNRQVVRIGGWHRCLAQGGCSVGLRNGGRNRVQGGHGERCHAHLRPGQTATIQEAVGTERLTCVKSDQMDPPVFMAPSVCGRNPCHSEA